MADEKNIHSAEEEMKEAKVSSDKNMHGEWKKEEFAESTREKRGFASFRKKLLERLDFRKGSIFKGKYTHGTKGKPTHGPRGNQG